MEWSLFLLLLMGQCFFFTQQHYEYHFIRENKTWSEAQEYCRHNYTDLATVKSMADLDRLCDQDHCEEGWIGLYTDRKTAVMWFWPSGTNQTSVTSPPPKLNCVLMWKELSLGSFTCKVDVRCFCHVNNLVLDIDVKTWLEIQTVCSVQDTDLEIQKRQSENNNYVCKVCEFNPFDVFQRFRDTWRWSDGSNNCPNWNPVHHPSSTGLMTQCAMMGDDRRWKNDSCGKQRPFYCYEDKLILIRELKTWSEALTYCRTHYGDLASITSTTQQTWVQRRAQGAVSDHVWVGLRYTCSLDLWYWVNQSLVCYGNWASEEPGRECDLAGAVVKETSKWVSKPETEKFNFICSK